MLFLIVSSLSLSLSFVVVAGRGFAEEVECRACAPFFLLAYRRSFGSPSLLSCLVVFCSRKKRARGFSDIRPVPVLRSYDG